MIALTNTRVVFYFLQCFACGVEAIPHKKEHDYQVFVSIVDSFLVNKNQEARVFMPNICLVVGCIHIILRYISQ